MARQFLPPVPPLTQAGFADPVWMRWLEILRNIIVESGGSVNHRIVDLAVAGPVVLANDAGRVIFKGIPTASPVSLMFPAGIGDGYTLNFSAVQNVPSITSTLPVGQTLSAPFTSLATGASVEYLYDASTSIWYKIG